MGLYIDYEHTLGFSDCALSKVVPFSMKNKTKLGHANLGKI